jgi:hypothetical protein
VVLWAVGAIDTECGIAVTEEAKCIVVSIGRLSSSSGSLSRGGGTYGVASTAWRIARAL